MREGSRKNNIRVFDLGDPEQGISHVVAPELGMVLPGATHAVPDSHASTVGGLGALAFGCGTTELAHILATQAIAMKRPNCMRIRLDGKLGPHVTAKDVALRIIAEIGVSGARGHVVEYAGEAVRDMPIEQRMTLCNLNIEMGGRSGFVAPDDATFAWIEGRPLAPKGALWDRALAHWRTLDSDEGANSTREHRARLRALEPQITWGTDPSQVLGISGRVPDPATPIKAGARRSKARSNIWACSRARRSPAFRSIACSSALAPTHGCPILQAAAAVVRGRHVRRGVVAHGGAGLSTVKRAAEAEGTRSCLPRSRIFLGRNRLLDVRGRQRRPRRARRTLRLHDQPQLRKPPRPACARIWSAPPPRLPLPSPGASPTFGNCWGEMRDAAVQHPYRRRGSTPEGRHQHRPGGAGRRVIRVSQAGLQKAFFMRARQGDDGSEDPDFVLNKPQFRNPGILVTGNNFGAGSSRKPPSGRCSPTISP